MTDSIADMLTRIRNANCVAKEEVTIPYAKMKETLAKILVKEGFLKDVKKTALTPKNKKDFSKPILKISLLYDKDEPVIRGIKLISKPGLRVYLGYKKLPKNFGFVTTIVSTSKGMMNAIEAKKKKLGGEIICKIW